MIKNKVKTTLIGLVVTASSLIADISEYQYDINSLVGIEGGYSSVGYENGTSLNNEQHNAGISSVGLKIGAESDDFRIFLSTRYQADADDRFSYLSTYGGEIQYKFNAAKALNFFIGLNAGIASMKFRADNEWFSRTISDPYYGGDLGVNLHLGNSTDLELGGRVMSIQASNTQNNISYLVGNTVSGYASLIFKWKMD